MPPHLSHPHQCCVSQTSHLNQSMVVPNQRGRRSERWQRRIDPTSLIPRTNELQLTAPVDRTTANVSFVGAAVLPAQAPPVLRGRYIAAEAHAVHSAGNGAAHITGGKQHTTAIDYFLGGDAPDGAGHSSLHAARHKTNANRHFFGEPIEGVVRGGCQRNTTRSSRVSKASIIAGVILMAPRTANSEIPMKTRSLNRVAWRVRSLSFSIPQ